MKTIIYTIKEFDRIIIVQKDEENKLINLDFMQGLCDSIRYEQITNREPNKKLIKIYKHLKAFKGHNPKTKHLDKVNLYNYAVELYCIAFIHQEIEYY